MKKFWQKCGKLLKDGSNLSYCDNPPCGYYAIFGIKYRWLNQQTMQPYNQCSWEFNVQPFEVINNKIQWSWYSSVCIPVNRTMGQSYHGKIRSGCWDQCVEWDQETWECKKYQQYCDFCVQMYVYNISGCFDIYQEFEDYFWGGCGRQQPYPNIFEEWYGTKYPTSQATECCQNYWNKVFTDKYMLNYALSYISMYQRWSVYGYYGEWAYQTQCYCQGDNCENWQPPCIGQGCTEECYQYEDHQVSVGSYAVMQNDTTINQYTYGGGWYGYDTQYCRDYPCYHQTCCDANAARGVIDSANSFMLGHLNNKNSYKVTGTNTTTCTNSSSLCTNFSYKSHPFDNFYGDTDSCRWHFNWYKLSLQRTDNTPSDAIGVKFKCYIKQTKANQGYGRGTSEVTETTTDLSLRFGQQYLDLPLANNINGMSYLVIPICTTNERGQCVYSEEQGAWDCKNQPHVTFWGQDAWQNDALTHNVEVKLTAIEYIR